MTDDHMIDNAAVASQIDFDEVTREAIKLNIIQSCRFDERQRAIDIIRHRLPMYNSAQQLALKECISSIIG